MELRQQSALDAEAGFVARPKLVAKRLDHMVGGDTYERAAAFQHLEHGLQDSDDGAIRAVHAFVKAALAVEVTEQLVGSVDEVNDQVAANVRPSFRPLKHRTPLKSAVDFWPREVREQVERKQREGFSETIASYFRPLQPGDCGALRPNDSSRDAEPLGQVPACARARRRCAGCSE